MHRFDTDTTELVSRCRFECGQGAAAGAAEPVVAGEFESARVGAVTLAAAEFPKHGRAGSWPGASISADGTTVAWIGEDVAEQAPTLADEGLEAGYQEPLWRRLPATANQTRRITGGSDPEAPGCEASGEVALAIGSDSASDPCQGPFVRERASNVTGGGFIKGAGDDTAPRLTGNGEEVVFGANARLISEGNDFNRAEEGNPTDLFLADMRPGITRTQALTPLTEAGSSEAESAEITDYEISPDGQQVAFSTVRTLFMLGQPTLISSALPEVGIGELYDADLAGETITRVTHGYEDEAEASQQPHRPAPSQGGDPYKQLGIPNELGALTPDFSGNGDQLVFTSTAANLVYGDGNSPPEPVSCCRAADGSDVFEVTRHQFVDEPTPQQISPASEPLLEPAWNLGVTALSRPNGSVLLYVQAPEVGAIRAGAQGAVVVQPGGAARTARHRSVSRARAQRTGAQKTISARGREAGAKGKARGKTKPGGAAKAVATRTVATRAAEAKEAGLTMLTLTLAPQYAALARERGGLSATVTVTFTSPDHRTLRASIPVTFARKMGRSEAHARKARGAAKAGERR